MDCHNLGHPTIQSIFVTFSQSCLLLFTGAPSFPLGGDLPEGNNLSDLMRAVDPNFLENLNFPSGSSSQFKVSNYFNQYSIGT